MKKITAKAAAYFMLAITGLAFAVYSAKIRNYVLLAVSVIFALVSADNIFCNLKKEA